MWFYIDQAQWRATIGTFSHGTCKGYHTATDYIEVLCQHFSKQHTMVQDYTEVFQLEVLDECQIN